MKPDAPLASVVVLNYNGAEVLPRCLEAVAAQTYGRFEIVVVDNGSTDESTALLERWERDGRIRLLRAGRNLGVAGGRNLALGAVRGEVVAFMDNDGFPHPDWLERAVDVLLADPSVGAVASVVFFNRNKLIVNGAGGTLNLHGYGGDYGFRQPLEFADLPDEALYPMGCGMVVRGALLRELAGFDDRIFNYYDDVDLGVRVWSAGYSVRVAHGAWVDHDWATADRINRNKAYLCERNRIRTVLKFFPWRHLPGFLLREVHLRRYLRIHGLRTLPLRAWAWNLRHLGSALRWRRRFRVRPRRYWHLVEKTWGQFPPPLPADDTCRLDTACLTGEVVLGAPLAEKALLFGWYPVSQEGEIWFRWAARVASLALEVEQRATRLEILYRTPGPSEEVRLVLRRLGTLGPVCVLDLEASPRWRAAAYDLDLPPGRYEALALCRRGLVDPWGRELALGLASIGLR